MQDICAASCPSSPSLVCGQIYNLMNDSPRMLTGRANTAREHEIELLWLANFVVCVGVSDVVFSTEFTELGARIVVQLHEEHR